jgi:hypothetical protein
LGARRRARVGDFDAKAAAPAQAGTFGRDRPTMEFDQSFGQREAYSQPTLGAFAR